MSRGNPIQDHFVVLCNQLNLESILPYLKAERMLTSEEYELFCGANRTISSRQKRERLLILMPRKGSNFFENFGNCLVWSGQAELARHIGVNVEAVRECPHGSTSGSADFQMMTELLSPGSGSIPPGMRVATGDSLTTIRNSEQRPGRIVNAMLCSARVSLGDHTAVPLPPTQPIPQDPPKVFLLYFKDKLFPRYDLDAQTQVETVLELARILTSAGGFSLTTDLFETRDIHNWNAWTEERILESRYVILLCSPDFRRVMTSGSGETLEMEKGAFFSSTIGPLIAANKSIFIPVFLPQFDHREVLPANLMSSISYTLDVAGMVGALESSPNLQNLLVYPQFTDWERLIRQLRGMNFEQVNAPLQPVTLPPEAGSSAHANRLPPQALHSVFKDTEFQEIAITVGGDWKNLGMRLGISYSQLQALEIQYSGTLGAAIAMLKEWQNKEGLAATRTVLKDALLHLGFGNVARRLFGN